MLPPTAESIVNVKPRQLAGWDIEITTRDLAEPTMVYGKSVTTNVDTITWTGALPNDFYQLFEISFMLRDMAELTLTGAEEPLDGMRPIYLPVTQVRGSLVTQRFGSAPIRELSGSRHLLLVACGYWRQATGCTVAVL